MSVNEIFYRKYLSVIMCSPIFAGLSEGDIASLLDCLQASFRTFPRNSFICRTGDRIDSIGLVLSGSVHVEFSDFLGNVSILQSLRSGGIFAETYACLPDTPLMVDVTAATDCEILFLNTRRLLHSCKNNCCFHDQVIYNLLLVSMHKNCNLSDKIFCISTRSTRGRIIAYLSQQAKQSGSGQFEIPFDRQQLANYLGVERSALSAELSRMQKDGLIAYKKNRFTLLTTLP